MRLDDQRTRLQLEGAWERAASRASGAFSKLYRRRSLGFVHSRDVRQVRAGRQTYAGDLTEARRDLGMARSALDELEAGIATAERELADLDADPGPRAA